MSEKSALRYLLEKQVKQWKMKLIVGTKEELTMNQVIIKVEEILEATK